MTLCNNQDKIILDLCGGTGAWSKPYKDAGYDVRLISLPDNDVRDYQPPTNVYGILVAPPCTEFTAFCLRRKRDYRTGLEIVHACIKIIEECLIWHYDNTGKNNGGLTGLRFWALENPGGKAQLRKFLGEPVFAFNPCDFGDQYKKETFLWGYFKKPIPLSAPMFGIKIAMIRNPEWDGKDRQTKRSITPTGFALAFYEANK